ncbi:hypothetical protein NB689_002341 [Xanthomonas sacchari]|nr:hypothetical protein [Xanthomonas sacchari]
MRVAGHEHLAAVIAVGQRAGATLEQLGAAHLHRHLAGLQRALRKLPAQALGIGVPVQRMPADRAQPVIALGVLQQRMGAAGEQHQAQPGDDGPRRRARAADAAMPPRQLHPAVRGQRQQGDQQQRRGSGRRRFQTDGPAEQHEHRPVPQIQRIRHAADRHRYAVRQRAPGPACRGAMQQRQQGECAQHRPQSIRPRRVAGTRAPQADHHRRQRHRQQRRTPAPGARRRRLRPGLEASAQRQHLVQQHAAAQLPEACGGQVERGRRIAGIAAMPPGERQRGGRGQRHQQRRPHPTAAATVPGQEQQREQQIELLLHAQRPGMRVRIEFGLGREVIVAGRGQHPVAEADEGHAPGPGAGLAEPGLGNEQAAGQGRDQQAHHQGRRDAAQAPRIELREHAQLSGRRQALQRRADHEAGDHEEHVHAGEPARQPCRIEVVGDHRQHRDRAQPVHVRQIAAAGLRVRRHVAAPGGQRARPWQRHVYQTRSSGIWYLGSA